MQLQRRLGFPEACLDDNDSDSDDGGDDDDSNDDAVPTGDYPASEEGPFHSVAGAQANPAQRDRVESIRAGGVGKDLQNPDLQIVWARRGRAYMEDQACLLDCLFVCLLACLPACPDRTINPRPRASKFFLPCTLCVYVCMCRYLL